MRVFHSSIYPTDGSQERRASGVSGESKRPFENWLRFEALRPLSCCLTAKDYSLLESRLIELRGRNEGTAPLLVQLIRTKLADAEIVLSEDVDPEVATTNSRVVFSVDGRAAETAVLVHWEHEVAREFALPITTLLGATLLGMRAGNRAPLLRSDGGIREVALLEIAFQPEAARRAMRRDGAASEC